MFTGIVQGKASVQHIKEKQALKTITLLFPANGLSQLQRGASVAINGVCLTVSGLEPENHQAAFDVMNETLARTNLASLKLDDEVNFERAAKIGDEIGGHLMSGHIHGRVTISRIVHSGDNCTIYFYTPRDYLPYLLEKGFVGLNGCSLTLGEVTAEEFCVHLIPETLLMTTFSQVAPGDEINLEIDHQTQCIVDTVERVLRLRNQVC